MYEELVSVQPESVNEITNRKNVREIIFNFVRVVTFNLILVGKRSSPYINT